MIDSLTTVTIQHHTAYEVKYKPEVVTMPVKQYFRVLHDAERPEGVRQVVLDKGSMPEVFRLAPDHHVIIREPFQWLWKNLNPLLTGRKWSKLLGKKLAFTNMDTGFPNHANYVLREDLDKAEPRFDVARVCGGAIVSGIVSDEWLVLDYIDANGKAPTVEYVQAHPELRFMATTVRPDGTIGRFPQADGGDVVVPLMASQPVRYPLKYLQKWNEKELPDPYKIYLT